MALSLAAVPAGFALAARAAERRLCVPSRRAAASLALAAVGWVGLGLWVHSGYATDAAERRLGENPHRVLLTSASEKLSGSRGAELPRSFPAGDLEEHKTFAERRRAPSSLPAELARPRNVVLLVLESTGARWLSLYGSPWDTTPRLKAEARHALVADSFYSHEGYTFCSLISLGFSVYPGLPWCWRPCGEAPLPPTLAQVLKPLGYATAFMSSGDLDWEGMGYMMRGRGFDAVLDQRDLPGPSLSSWGKQDRLAFQAILRWVDAPARAGRPFYVMCWTDQTHDPYQESPDASPIDFFPGREDRRDLSRYLNVLREVDAGIGELLDGLRARGLADDTLVAITGDHGEAFGFPHDVRGHGSALYEENVRVPLVLWSPRLFGGEGRRAAEVAGHVDLAPTLVDALGVEPAGAWQGESLFARERSGRAYFESGISEYQFGVREGEWKYVYNATLGSERLYHLASDPDELRDLAADEPGRSRRLRERVAAFIAAEETHLRGDRIR
jgi:arylsulfatase A-like enzyme